ncbi:MAG: HdeD family acid-resistance protein [Desulfobaccales bacterium]|nr:HdeD family acid-resistance protein [Desulfobaccales bacterium]
MTDKAGFSIFNPQLTDVQEFRHNWGWFLALGIILIVFGTIAVGSSVLVTLASVLFFGWLLLFMGLIEAVQAFWQRKWGGIFLHLLCGILTAVVGLIFVANPGAGALVLTLILAVLFMVAGLFRIIAALMMRFPHWGWLLLSGGVTLVLGLLIWRQWPVSGLWVFGMFIGIDMIFCGWSWVMAALAARRLPA